MSLSIPFDVIASCSRRSFSEGSVWGASSCVLCWDVELGGSWDVALGVSWDVGWEFSRDLIEGVGDGEFDLRGEFGELWGVPCDVPRGDWLPSGVAVFGSIIRWGRIDA